MLGASFFEASVFQKVAAASRSHIHRKTPILVLCVPHLDPKQEKKLQVVPLLFEIQHTKSFPTLSLL